MREAGPDGALSDVFEIGTIAYPCNLCFPAPPSDGGDEAADATGAGGAGGDSSAEVSSGTGGAGGTGGAAGATGSGGTDASAGGNGGVDASAGSGGAGGSGGGSGGAAGSGNGNADNGCSCTIGRASQAPPWPKALGLVGAIGYLVGRRLRRRRAHLRTVCTNRRICATGSCDAAPSSPEAPAESSLQSP